MNASAGNGGGRDASRWMIEHDPIDRLRRLAGRPRQMPLLLPHPTWSLHPAARPGEILHEFEPFVMSTTGMARYVHRPRSATRYPPRRVAAQAWCGQGMSEVIGLQRPPPHYPLCGTCEGRAVGAGFPTAEQVVTATGSDPWHRLRFTPRPDFDPPRVCPGTMTDLYIEDPTNWRVGRCLVCHRTVRLRSGGGWWSDDFGPQAHEPYEIVRPCINHAWRYLEKHGDPPAVRCRCKREDSGWI